MVAQENKEDRILKKQKEKEKKELQQQEETQQKEKVQEKSLAQQRIELQQVKEARQKEEQQGNEQQQENRSRGGRYRTKPQTPQEKRQYFLDYYLGYVVIGVIALVVAGSLLKTMVFDRTEKVLSVVVMGYDQPDTETISNELREYLGIENEDQTISISCLTPGDYQTEMAMTTWIAAQDVDLIISEPETFENYTGKGYFADLSEILDESLLARVQDDLKVGQTVEYNDNGEISTYGEECNYGIGISLDESKTDFTQGGDNWVLSVCINAQHLENVLEVIPYFLD